MASSQKETSTGGGSDGKDVVISYGREAGVNNFVRKLKTDLESAGHSVWMDVSDIPTGSEWPNQIGVALRNCTTVITVITKKYAGSKYCRSELLAALDDKKAIIPLIYEDGWADSDDGVGLKLMIGSFNWGMFRPGKDNYDHSLQMLLDGLKGSSMSSAALNQRRVSSDAVDDAPDTISRLDQRPTLKELKTLKLPGGQKVEVIKSLAANWKDLGISLDFDDDGMQLDLIEAQYALKGPIECCTQTLKHWLAKNGKQPISWRTLIELLEDCDQGYLAEQLNVALQS